MTEKVTFTNMCMISDGNSVLVQNRVDKNWGGYCFPGGHVETDESFVQAVVREVYEETGLNVYNPVLCGIKHWQNGDVRNVVLLYKASDFSGTLQSSEEGEVFWLDLEELKQSEKLADSFEGMLKVFLDDRLSEHYWEKDELGCYQEKIV